MCLPREFSSDHPGGMRGGPLLAWGFGLLSGAAHAKPATSAAGEAGGGEGTKGSAPRREPAHPAP